MFPYSEEQWVTLESILDIEHERSALMNDDERMKDIDRVISKIVDSKDLNQDDWDRVLSALDYEHDMAFAVGDIDRAKEIACMITKAEDAVMVMEVD